MNCTTNLLNLQPLIINDSKESENNIIFFCSTLHSPQLCPHCKQYTSKIHGYRNQIFKDLSIREKFVSISLKKRRYICSCGKTFFENYPFLPKYYRATSRFFSYIIDKFYSNSSLKSIAETYNVSSNTVSRMLKLVSLAPAPDSLPETLAIDEFKGNTDGQKYNCILTNPKNRKIVDILPDRNISHLIDYFKQYKNRDIAWLFPNAKIIVDKFHWIRQIYWALDKVRKNVQMEFYTTKRKYFKANRKLLFKRYSDLKDEQKQEVSVMLWQSEKLYKAWLLKEDSYKIREAKTMEEAEQAFHNWLIWAENTEMAEFKDCITAFHNWSREIINSIIYGYNNGYTEGINNLIKVIKRNAYGYHKFENLRKRIFLVSQKNSHQLAT